MTRSVLRRFPRTLPILVALLALGLASPALAAELGGTAWNVSGALKVKLRGQTNGPLGLGGVLTFDGLATDAAGTCLLDLSRTDTGDPLGSVPCNWTSSRGRKFAVVFDEAAFDAALGGFIEDRLPGASATVTLDPASGVMAPKTARITLRMKVVTEVSVPPGRGAKLKTDLLLIGTPRVP
ncbi:MAG: hypothetical protein MUC67_06220 [Acidobacteria bacterium]|jgi:hypothetical protein|nr:hypothetical protein [Acidobacteriota bacterium]MCU0253456.1 hypothetical protein [Acidobacteriota bacterium]